VRSERVDDRDRRLVQDRWTFFAIALGARFILVAQVTGDVRHSPRLPPPLFGKQSAEDPGRSVASGRAGCARRYGK
jgi:hypothetical protein